jgi:hypothetical protein
MVHVDAALGVAAARDTAAIEPNDVNASATAMTILRIPTMFIRSVSGFGPPLPPRFNTVVARGVTGPCGQLNGRQPRLQASSVDR